MYFANCAMENGFVGASAAASFGMSESTAEMQNVLGTALLAVSIFILSLRLCVLVPVRIMLVSVLLAVLVVWNRNRPNKIEI